MTGDLTPWSPLQPQSHPKSVFLMFALDLGVVGKGDFGKGVRWLPSALSLRRLWQLVFPPLLFSEVCHPADWFGSLRCNWGY